MQEEDTVVSPVRTCTRLGGRRRGVGSMHGSHKFGGCGAARRRVDYMVAARRGSVVLGRHAARLSNCWPILWPHSRMGRLGAWLDHQSVDVKSGHVPAWSPATHYPSGRSARAEWHLKISSYFPSIAARHSECLTVPFTDKRSFYLITVHCSFFPHPPLTYRYNY
jgi:hypothetical protein